MMASLNFNNKNDVDTSIPKASTSGIGGVDSCISSSSSSSIGARSDDDYYEEEEEECDDVDSCYFTNGTNNYGLNLVISTSDDATVSSPEKEISSPYYYNNSKTNINGSTTNSVPENYNNKKKGAAEGITTTTCSSKSSSAMQQQQQQRLQENDQISNEIINTTDAALSNIHRMKRPAVSSQTTTSNSSNTNKLLPPRINNVFVNHQQQQQHNLFFYDSDGDVSAGSNATLVFINPNNNPAAVLGTSTKHASTPRTTTTATHIEQQQQQQKRKYMPFLPYQLDTPMTKISTTSSNSHHERQSSWGSLNSVQTNNSLIFTAAAYGTDEDTSSAADKIILPVNVGVPTTIITAPSSPIRERAAIVDDSNTDNNCMSHNITTTKMLSTAASDSSYYHSLLVPKEQQELEQQHPTIPISSTERKREGKVENVPASLPELPISPSPSKGTTTSLKSTNNNNYSSSSTTMPPRLRPVTPQKTTSSPYPRGNTSSNKSNNHSSNSKKSETPPSPLSTTKTRLTDFLPSDLSQFLRLNSTNSATTADTTSGDEIAKEKQKQKFHERNQAFLKQQQQQNIPQRGVISSPLGAAVARPTITSITTSTTAAAPPPSPSAILLLTNRSFHSHRRLSSIDNDDWEDDGDEDNIKTDKVAVAHTPPAKKSNDTKSNVVLVKPSSSSVTTSSSNDEDTTTNKNTLEQLAPTDEKTFLLLPSLNKNTSKPLYGSAADSGTFLSSSSSASSPSQSTSTTSPTKTKKRSDKSLKQEEKYARQLAKKNREKLRRKMEKKSIKRLSKSINLGANIRGGNYDVDNQEADDISSTQSFASSSSSSSSSSEDYYHKGYNEAYILRKAHKRALRYEAERNSLIEQWKAEYRAEAEKAKALEEYSKWYNRLYRWISSSPFVQRVKTFFRFLTLVFSNLPSTIAGNALAVTTLGIVWFKFAEGNIDSCHPVHYHSHQCHYMEFPGCFYCDTSDPWYKLALRFHLVCTAIGGALALCLVLKIILAWKVVLDELSSPTTSSPAGLMCMTLVCVFAVFGSSAKMIVLAAAFLHLCLVVWFNYMALAYRILPDPSWYPNTVGVGLSAVKTWLYYPWAGHFLMALSLGLNFTIFPISVIRVFVNEKISATVCWIQMSAPAVSLYALTIMAQPTFQEEQPDVSTFDRIHRAVYLPVMHIMFSLALIGVISAVHSLWVRWDVIRTKSFSPAHAAFPFPLLAHVNAIQAYRSAVDTFSTPSAFFQRMLYVYWLFMLLVGTVLTVVITGLFLYYLPRWTNVDVTDEVEPPAPNETVMAEIINKGFFEGFQQRFVSPAVLQANETGVLVRDASSGNYVRTRRIAALGFDPTMSWSEMNEARDTLLDWVSKNPPRHRHNTLSVPGISVQNFGRGNAGVYNDLEADFGLDHHPLGAGGSRNIHVSNRPRANSEKEMRRSHNMHL